MSDYSLSNLDILEAEAIHIMREVVAEFERPVMLYSIGKDSSVMLRLAQKAFYPAPLPFELLHVDTTFKFPEMYVFREKLAEDGVQVKVHVNLEAKAENCNPYDTDSYTYTTRMKTHGLLQALEAGRYDAAFGGARRDEEKSRAKERIFSFRDRHGQWDPKNQRPELWNLYNGRLHPGESIRVFPISNWTELDIWMYIKREAIPVVPLYFAAERDVYQQGDQWLPVYPNTRIPTGAERGMRMVRYRTLGCHPLTCAVESTATTIDEVVAEMMTARDSERVTRLIDNDRDCSMEQKKQEGYF
jgi:sulfate adenylyltransferase subunit 2